jgi:hypothetical protein
VAFAPAVTSGGRALAAVASVLAFHVEPAPVAAPAPKVAPVALEPLALASPDVEPALEPLALCTPIALSSLAPAPVGRCDFRATFVLARHVTWDAWCMTHEAARDVERWAVQLASCKPAPKVEPALEPAPVAPVASPAPKAPKAAPRARRAKIDPSSEHPAIARWTAVRGALATLDAAVRAPVYTYARAAASGETDPPPPVDPNAPKVRRAKGAPPAIDKSSARFEALDALDTVCAALAVAWPVIGPIASGAGEGGGEALAGILAHYRAVSVAPGAQAVASPTHTGRGLLGPKVGEALDALESEAEAALGSTTAIRAEGSFVDGVDAPYRVVLDVLDLRAWVRSLPSSVRSVAFDRGDRRVAMRAADLKKALDASIRRGCVSVHFAEDGSDSRGGPTASFVWHTPAGRGCLRFRSHSDLLGHYGDKKKAREGVYADVALDLAALTRANGSSRLAA